MAALTEDDIKNRFYYHKPSENGTLRHTTLSELFSNMAKEIDTIMPDGREKSITITKLEEAKMWASAGVARNPETC
jgi:hypothetical protein